MTALIAMAALILATALGMFAWGLWAKRRPYVPDGGENTDDDPATERRWLR